VSTSGFCAGPDRRKARAFFGSSLRPVPNSGSCDQYGEAVVRRFRSRCTGAGSPAPESETVMERCKVARGGSVGME
jgi:hypothetical protein